MSKTRLRRIQYATGADDLKQSFSLNIEYRVRRRKRKDCGVFLMQNQIKVDKNRKGILFFLDFGPLICGGDCNQSHYACHAWSRPLEAIVRAKIYIYLELCRSCMCANLSIKSFGEFIVGYIKIMVHL